MRAIEKRLKRNPELPKWDILIEPMAAVLMVYSLLGITLSETGTSQNTGTSTNTNQDKDSPVTPKNGRDR
jgi:hypothetical protein